MTPEWVAILVSVVALSVSLITYALSSRISKGQVELQIRELISSARRHFNEMYVPYIEEEAIKNKNGEVVPKKLQPIIDSAREDVLNAYDEACKKYLDKKVDQTCFKQMYTDEIRQLVEHDSFKKHRGPDSRYRFILKVYEAWRS